MLIRGTFQRVPAASEGLLKAELSETHQYFLRAVCLLSIPQLTSGELTSNGLQLALKRVPILLTEVQNKLHSSGNVEEDGECWLMDILYIRDIV